MWRLSRVSRHAKLSKHLLFKLSYKIGASIASSLRMQKPRTWRRALCKAIWVEVSEYEKLTDL